MRFTVDYNPNYKHGLSDTGAYASWKSMMHRCYRERTAHYERYGGRGIKVCDQWHDFDKFYADMGDRPEGRSLDRIHNDQDYTPENCRWATTQQQARNRNSNHVLCCRTLVEWAELAGMNRSTLSRRIHADWPLKRALCTPVRKSRRVYGISG